MKRIPLTQSQFALVDDENYEWLNQWKWVAIWSNKTKSFYAVRTTKRKNDKWQTIFMAREILGLSRGDKRQGDHINHITLDNQISNLRIVTNQQNHFNRKNSKGYSWNIAAKKYMAQITLNGKHIYLGFFHVAEDAHIAYLKAKEQYHVIRCRKTKMFRGVK